MIKLLLVWYRIVLKKNDKNLSVEKPMALKN